MDFAKKLKAIRLAEGLRREEMAQLVGIPKNTIRNHEQGANSPRLDSIVKIVKHGRFKKYLFWLMIDDELLEAGQISPPLEILKQLEKKEVQEEIGKKIKAMRLAECMTEDAFSSILGITKKHLKLIEKCREVPTSELLTLITHQDVFKKYALWFVNEHASLDEQTSPSAEILARCKIEVKSSK